MNEKSNLSLCFCVKKTTKYKEKVRPKSGITAISGIFLAFSAGKKFSSKIGLGHVIGIANAHLCAKNQKKLMMKSRENAKKPVFRHISGIFGRKWIFSGNRAPSHFGHCYFAPLCQKSEKTNEPISRKAGNRRTDGRTNGQRLIYRTSKVGPKRG